MKLLLKIIISLWVFYLHRCIANLPPGQEFFLSIPEEGKNYKFNYLHFNV